jgi:hypothetical protein
MIENLKIHRKEFISLCVSLEAALKYSKGVHVVTFHFSPGNLRLASSLGEGTVVTDGKANATGSLAMRSIKTLIRTQRLSKIKRETLNCILAPGLSKLIIEDGALKINFK